MSIFLAAEKYKDFPFSSCMAITQTFDGYFDNFGVSFFKINIIVIDEDKMNEKVYLQVPDNSIRLEIKKTISIIQTYFIQRLRSLTIKYKYRISNGTHRQKNSSKSTFQNDIFGPSPPCYILSCFLQTPPLWY